MAGMTFSTLTSGPPVLSVPLRAPLASRGILEELSNNAVAQRWWLIGPFLTIVGVLVGAVVLRWVLHRAIDRVVTAR